jgi:ADP-heptose:LPS heptosyltransferase
VICLPGIGDALMATPMIRVLKARFPDVTVDAACMFGGVAEVFRRNPDIAEVHDLPLYGGRPLAGLRAAAALRRQRYALSILAYPAYRREYHAVHRLIGARERIAHRFPQGHRRELGFLETATVAVDFGVHNVINNLGLLSALGVDWRAFGAPGSFQYVLPITDAERSDGSAAIRSHGFEPSRTIAIHPGSTASPAGLRRRWANERWVDVMRHLVDARQREVLVFSGPDEGSLGEELVAAADRPGRVVLAKTRSFAHALTMLASCSMLIHSDNGFGHLAVALGVPVVSLFGVTDYRWSGPYSSRLLHVVHPEPYRPWHRYELKRGIPAGAHDGMADIEVSAVLEAFMKAVHLP